MSKIKTNLYRWHVKALQTILNLSQQLRINLHFIWTKLFNILVTLEGASERLNDAQVEELAHEGQGTGLAGRLLVAAGLARSHVSSQFLRTKRA